MKDSNADRIICVMTISKKKKKNHGALKQSESQSWLYSDSLNDKEKQISITTRRLTHLNAKKRTKRFIDTNTNPLSTDPLHAKRVNWKDSITLQINKVKLIPLYDGWSRIYILFPNVGSNRGHLQSLIKEKNISDWHRCVHLSESFVNESLPKRYCFKDSSDRHQFWRFEHEARKYH